MCKFSENLIAWLDQELPAEQAANVARHVRACTACRGQIEVYRQLSEAIDAYCDAVLVSNAKSRSSARVRPTVFAASAVAAAAALFFLLLGPAERLRSLFSAGPNGVPAIARKATPVPAPRVEKVHSEAAAEKVPKRIRSQRPSSISSPLVASPNRDESWLPNEAPVYIAIPADALFPPGALPDGVGFVADVNLRPDGSAQRLRLEPQLVGFPTRGTRP